MCVRACARTWMHVHVCLMSTMYVWKKYAETEGEIRQEVGGGREVNEHWWNEGA